MQTTLIPTTIIPLDDLSPSSSAKRFSSSTERAKSKLSTASSAAATSKFTAGGRRKENQKPIHESDVETENLPVIQGSFEITKTDADIAQKRTDANQRPASTVSLAANTLKPFYISPASSMKIKSSERSSTSAPMPTNRSNASENILEMFLQHQKQQIHQKIKESTVTAKIEKTNKNGEAVIDQSTTESITTTTTTSTTTTAKPVESPVDKELPQLAPSLFTSPPVLDNEPWRPINPSPSQIKANFPTLTTEASDSPSTSTDLPDAFRAPFNPYPPENVMYRNKFVDPDTIYDSNDTDVFYQSYYNPGFSAGDLAVEKLGIADVKPYPLPVNKIDLTENVPSFKPLETPESDDVKLNYDEDRFEHLGGGVIAKKPDTVTESLVVVQELEPAANATEEAPTELGDIFQELLDLDEATLNLTKSDDNQLESRVAPDDDESPATEINPTTTAERLNFMNMKDFIVQMQKNKSDEDDASSAEMVSVRTTEKPTTTFVEVETLKYTPAAVAIATQPQLFPISISKWEFVNGTQTNATEASLTRKVFNETLQAVVVENSQTSPPHASRFDDLKANRTIDKANLQQLSSIFDTLAAKLGIRPIDLASKSPPFGQHNKLKNNSNRTRTTTKRTKPASTTPINRQRPTTTKLSSTTKLTTARPTTKLAAVTYESSSETMVGQAEVEPVDPTKYEEILSLMSSSPVTRITSTTPSLVTLLPVKSNSGIRNFNPRIKLPSRDENRNLETVVKTSMSFES